MSRTLVTLISNSWSFSGSKNQSDVSLAFPLPTLSSANEWGSRNRFSTQELACHHSELLIQMSGRLPQEYRDEHPSQKFERALELWWSSSDSDSKVIYMELILAVNILPQDRPTTQTYMALICERRDLLFTVVVCVFGFTATVDALRTIPSNVGRGCPQDILCRYIWVLKPQVTRG